MVQGIQAPPSTKHQPTPKVKEMEPADLLAIDTGRGKVPRFGSAPQGVLWGSRVGFVVSLKSRV